MHIQQDNLLTFLKKDEDYLTDRGFSFDLNEDDGSILKRSARFWWSPPAEAMEIELYGSLVSLIQEMSDDEYFERAE